MVINQNLTNMKKTIFFILAIFLSIGLSAQSFGLKGGASIASVVGGDVPSDVESVTGVVFGMFTQSGDDAIRYTTELNFIRKGFGGSTDETYYYYSVKTELLFNYIDVVLMGNFHVTDEFAINAGPYVGYALSGKAKQTINGNSESASIEEWDGYNRFDVGAAAGVSYWINDMLMIDARYAYGFTSIFEEVDAYNGVIQLSVGYLFSY